MNPAVSLAAIVALARAGAVGRAWELFTSGGYERCSDDAAALAVYGRLLKSRASLGDRAARSAGFAAAADAYAQAYRLVPAPYLMINIASLHLLAGDIEESKAAARAVLAILDGPEPPADTPYFLAAARAEALLLLGDLPGAAAAMAAAAAADPDGWSDRATTLTQLEAVSQAMNVPVQWLDPYRPPACLHFVGHMGIAAAGASARALAIEVDALLQADRIGFGYGALAAGADIIIAERLVARGAELHVALPCPVELFEQQSVVPAGQDWAQRYRALLAAATTVRSAGLGQPAVHDPLATGLAGELAIGGALLNARLLHTAACQLVVLDEAGGGANSVRQAALWRTKPGQPQHCLTIARDIAVERLFPPEAPDPARDLAVLVAVGLSGGNQDVPPPSAKLAGQQRELVAALAAVPPAALRASAGLWEVQFAALDPALELVERLHAVGDVAVGVHLAIVTTLTDPVSGARVPYGPGPRVARRLQAMALPGIVLASEDLAVVLATRGVKGWRAEFYHDGDDMLTGGVYTLQRRDQ